MRKGIRRHERQFPIQPVEGRQCGDCYACCVSLGIDELRKYAGQSCKHLDGRIPDKRCKIYQKRPTACSAYECMWLVGWGPDWLRPHDSGLLITPYRSGEGRANITVHVTDMEKAKSIETKVVCELLMLPFVDEVRLIYLATRRALMFRDGGVYSCKLLPQSNYESLEFVAEDKPIYRYAAMTEEEAAQWAPP